jgi:hypothetical protein
MPLKVISKSRRNWKERHIGRRGLLNITNFYAVKRHKDRFPEDFMFQLTMEEAKIWWTEVRSGGLRSQIVTLKRGQHIKYRPYAFTEHGILMLSSVLSSERAIKVNIEIMRAFVRLRRILASNKELAKRLDELEKKYDVQFKLVFDAIRQLMAPPEPEPPKKRIGFLVEEPHVYPVRDHKSCTMFM